VETAVLAFVGAWARDRGATVLQGEYIRTAKNAPAAGFYPAHGFSQVEPAAAERTVWQRRIDGQPVRCPAFIRLEGELVA
jgi:predicted enzyme involved in methoxymalonyl-ACP biosynthesis